MYACLLYYMHLRELCVATSREYTFGSAHHNWRRPLCRGPEALGKGPLTLGKGFAEGGPRQRALGEFWVGEEGLCRGPFIGHSAKPLPRAGAALGKEKQPSQCRRLGRSLCRGPYLGALGKELFFFFEKSLRRASNHGPRQRNVQNFSKKSLPRASPQALGKEILIFF